MIAATAAYPEQAMRGVFLDFDTVSHHDIDTTALDQVLPGIIYYGTSTAAEAASRLADAAIVMVNKIRLDEGLLNAGNSLRLVALAATGTDNVDLDAARRANVGVCNVTAYCTASVAQHVFALVLALNQRLGEYRHLLESRAWRRKPQFCLLDFPIRELEGKMLGVIGFGELGRRVAGIAEAFGMRTLVSRRPGLEDRRPGRVAMDELLRRADVVTLHCPLTDDTRGLIGERELALMKPDALLINTARGGLVDPLALVAALGNERIGGAGIDVLRQEPPVDGDPLIQADLPNLIVTPHIAWAAREARQRCIDEIAANIRSYLERGDRCRVV